MADMFIRLLVFLAAGCTVWLLFTTWMTIRWLTHPPRRTLAWAISKHRPASPSELSPPRHSQEFTVQSRGVTLACWLVSGDAPAAPTLVMSHGWGDSRVTMLERAHQLAPGFSSILLWDLPGHGTSTGTCGLGTNEHLHIPDLLAALPLETNRSIVLYGYSLGAGVSLLAAAEWQGAIPLRALILEAPYRFAFTPAANVMDSIAAPWRVNLRLALLCLGLDLGYGLTFARSGRFDRAAIARRCSTPILILHGEADTISPPSDGRDIAQAAPHATLLSLESAGHTDIWSGPETARQALAAIHTLLQ